ncbi:vegetative cell wall protein gp1-like [Balamuthia mandrillaris]
MNYLKQKVNTLNGVTVATESAISKEAITSTIGRTRVELAGLFVNTEVDEEFETGRQNIEKLIKNVEVIEKRLKNYSKAFEDFVKPLLALGESLQTFYNEDSDDLNEQGNLFMASSNTVAEAIKEFTTTMQELCTEVRTLLTNMSQMKKSILERDEALIEFTKADNHFKSVLKKETDLSSPKATKAQARQQECKDKYDALNNDLKSKFADYDLNRATQFEAQFSKLVNSQAKLFGVAAKASQDLQAQTQTLPSSVPPSFSPSSPQTLRHNKNKNKNKSSSSSGNHNNEEPSSPPATSPRVHFAALHSQWSPTALSFCFLDRDNKEGHSAINNSAILNIKHERRRSWDSPRASRNYEAELAERLSSLAGPAAAVASSLGRSQPPPVPRRDPLSRTRAVTTSATPPPVPRRDALSRSRATTSPSSASPPPVPRRETPIRPPRPARNV